MERDAVAPRGVLVLLVDCLRADALAAGGSELGATPHLDALAREAIVFERAYSVASWTRPAVPSLFTGLYPSEHGLVDLLEKGGTVRAAVLADGAETLAEGMQAAGYRTALFGEQTQLSRRFNLHQGFDTYQNALRSAASSNRALLDWLDAEPKRPFFAYLHYLEIHWPYSRRRATGNRFGSRDITSAFDGNLATLRKRLRSGDYRLDDADRRELRARYAEALAALDSDIGHLLDELGRRGLLEETLVIVTSDHGEELGERGVAQHGHTLHDELLHVPFYWKPPAAWRLAGRREPGLVEIRSLAPTLFELVGRPIDERVSAPSLLPWLRGTPSGQPREFVAAESNGIFSVQTDRWKLITTPAEGAVALYDHAADPGELHDVAGQHPEALAVMTGHLRRWRASLRPLDAAVAELDRETEDGLRALGYLQ